MPSELDMTGLDRDIYRAINVCRLTPKWFVQHVEEVHKDKELIPDSKGGR